MEHWIVHDRPRFCRRCQDATIPRINRDILIWSHDMGKVRLNFDASWTRAKKLPGSRVNRAGALLIGISTGANPPSCAPSKTLRSRKKSSTKKSDKQSALNGTCSRAVQAGPEKKNDSERASPRSRNTGRNSNSLQSRMTGSMSSSNHRRASTRHEH